VDAQEVLSPGGPGARQREVAGEARGVEEVEEASLGLGVLGQAAAGLHEAAHGEHPGILAPAVPEAALVPQEGGRHRGRAPSGAVTWGAPGRSLGEVEGGAEVAEHGGGQGDLDHLVAALVVLLHGDAFLEEVDDHVLLEGGGAVVHQGDDGGVEVVLDGDHGGQGRARARGEQPGRGRGAAGPLGRPEHDLGI
jgi:hypothetical protein